MYQQQVSASKDTIQVLLNTSILTHQVADKEATDKVLPRLDETQKMINSLGALFNQRMAALESSFNANISSQDSPDTSVSTKTHYETLGKMKKGLIAAASVVSASSTTLGLQPGEGSTVFSGSEFGDISIERTDLTTSWVERISESEELAATPSSISGRDVAHVTRNMILSESDSEDDELGQEMVRAFLDNGVTHLELKEYVEARASLQDCIDSV
ncbi:hypothetical protein EJ04DRAFT_28042 [Polyplosphaeria fusca]|uniref:Uncharacterized protein n=1 Tax=Polyplosphaeria fusca TaxID=682080 RepID=A0A9P4V3U1_9PLEO|nr:hypothetical protein EJ04DRAFT_28042 [Polyplosphaeria fusca]